MPYDENGGYRPIPEGSGAKHKKSLADSKIIAEEKRRDIKEVERTSFLKEVVEKLGTDQATIAEILEVLSVNDKDDKKTEATNSKIEQLLVALVKDGSLVRADGGEDEFLDDDTQESGENFVVDPDAIYEISPSAREEVEA